MLGFAWWTCVLAVIVAPAPGGARVLERCELARELRQLGVRDDQVSTWVCVAFHESRFDTAAHNPHSGDHGLLQISQLYWCGAGKACGISCGALRDDDIADDVECALLVYDEHTRLQGDGFLAWVVYPQHCKQNTKKYLAGCNDSLKDISTAKPMEHVRANSDTDHKTNATFRFNPLIDELKPLYFSTSSNSRHHNNDLENSNLGKDDRSKWTNTRFSNIDDLLLPVFDRTAGATSGPLSPTSITTTTTATLQQLKHIKKIETNHFRGDTHTTVTVPGTTEGASLVLSNPHFLYADPLYQNGVIGMTPNEDLHRIIVELEPRTGTVLRGGSKAQFNIFLRPISQISGTANLPNALTPIFWVEEGALLPEEFRAELEEQLLSTLRLVGVLVPAAVALGAALLLLGAGLTARAATLRRRQLNQSK